jgi:hypothetical protein
MSITCVITAINSPWLSTTNTGLGNILFQISTCIGLGNKYNRKWSFPEIKEVCVKYNNLGLSDYSSTIFRNVPMGEIQPYTLIEEQFSCPQRYDEDMIALIENTIGNIKLSGYMQSHLYFNKYRDYIINLFSIDNISLQYIHNKYPMISDEKFTPISLHIRQCYGYNIKYSADYFNDAVKYIKERGVKNPLFYIFSDDINWCKNNIIIGSDNTVYVENNPDYIDLWLMSLCKHNIISHSTFSWWGAYLNQNNEKIVIYSYDILRLYWSKIYSEPTDLLRVTQHYFDTWVSIKTKTII